MRFGAEFWGGLRFGEEIETLLQMIRVQNDYELLNIHKKYLWIEEIKLFLKETFLILRTSVAVLIM